MADFPYESLRRWPDTEAANLVAVDATDRYLIDTVLEQGNGPISVVDDRYGAISLALAWQGLDVRVWQDSALARRALAANANRLSAQFEERGAQPPVPCGDLAAALASARSIVWQLPKSLDAVRELAQAMIAEAPGADVFAGARVKHLTRAVGDVLAESYRTVTPLLARQKSRILHATDPLGDLDPAEYPRRRIDPETGLVVCAHGAVFAGRTIDIGTRFLLEFVPEMRDGQVALDLGCGSGVLAAALARACLADTVIASDDSAAAVASAAATAAANGLAIETLHDDSARSLPGGSVDLIVCNPPFHSGSAVQDSAGRRLLGAASRLLAPGGELWTVYNSHLNHAAFLRRAVGPTEQRGRNRKFTVTRTVLAPGAGRQA